MTITYPKLKPSFKVKWIAALRSGEYARGNGALCQEGKSFDKFCCLGIACNILAPGKWEEDSSTKLSIDGETEFPPPSIIEKMFQSHATKFMHHQAIDIAMYELADKNDNGWSFNRIATWIEKNL
jgi:hypothetical protein